jgi:subtilisin-like proprotein convertase family protein
MKLHPVNFAVLAFLLSGMLLSAGCGDNSEPVNHGTDTTVADPGNGNQDTAVVADVVAEVAAETTVVAAGENADRSLVKREGRTCTPVVDHLVINELMIDTTVVSDANGEWIELYNPTATAVNIQGWYIAEDGPGIHQITASLVVPSNGYVVLCRNIDPQVNGGVTCQYQLTNFGLLNGGDSVILLDASLVEVDKVVYGGSAPAPTGASLGLKHPYLDNATIVMPAVPNDPAIWAPLNWALSTTAFGAGEFGTPGAKNDGYVEQEQTACYDGNVCTYDACTAGTCTNPRKPNCCLSNGDCVDQDVCTQDLCDLNTLKCTFNPIEDCCITTAQCLDENPCNADYCIQNRCRHSAYNIVPGCCYAPLTTNPATGLPWTSEVQRTAYANSQCDDKKFCTPDFCDMGVNECRIGTAIEDCCNLNNDCDDGNPCTYDACWNHQCTNEVNVYDCCQEGHDDQCDDNDPCTTDTCYGSSCRHYWNADQCCYDNAWCVANADDGNPCTAERCLLDPVSQRFTCQHPYEVNCTLGLPYVEPFDNVDTFKKLGWTLTDYQSQSTSHWQLESTTGELGPDTHVAFTWDPLPTIVVKSVAATPLLDGTTAAKDRYNSKYLKTTLQWRMSYKHSAPGQSVKLRVMASDNNDFLSGTLLAEFVTDKDIEYALYTAELPDTVKFSPTLKIGFLIDTAPGSTYMIDTWEIDDVKVAAGKTNSFLSAKIYRCPQDGRPCNTVTGTKVAESPLPGKMPDVLAGSCDWMRIYMCYRDLDGSNTTWQTYGFPASYLDSAPLDRPPFMAGAPDVGQSNSCDTLPTMVQLVCGVPAVSVDGYYYCGIDIKPECNEDYAGQYRSGLVSRDEYDKTGVKKLHSPFESLTKFNMTVLMEDGYIVWSPNGTTDPSAVAIKKAIKDSGRRAQIINDLAMIPDLTNYDGVFVVLGVHGRYTSLSPIAAARLRLFLDGGGKVYLEGGDFFYTLAGAQASTVIHPYFKIDATSDGTMRLAGPVVGKNFLEGAQFDVSQSAQVNSWIDKLVHKPEAGGREILRDSGLVDPFAVAIAYDPAGNGGTYRSIGSSVPFSALVENGSMTSTQLMTMYLNFLENGYPPCATAANCEDFEVCTTDSCDSTVCSNSAIQGCVPCKDDKYRPDGSLSCTVNQACDQDLGYCVNVPGFRWDADCSKVFGSSPVSAACSVNVPVNGVVDSSNFKVALSHAYRGDVKLTVTSPGGTTVTLREDNISDSKRNIYETYDIGVDSADPLSAFVGQASVGTWTVVAEDTDPTMSNGVFEYWRLFAELSDLACTTAADCPQTLCQTAICNGASVCEYSPVGCDDGKNCTIDSCNPTSGECEHLVIQACGGACETHDDCFRNEVCLISPAENRVCDPAVDFDPATGDSLCTCRPIEGTPYEYNWQTGLPASIPDNNIMGLTKTLNVTASGYVKKFKVKIRTEHEAAGDLRAELCHEDVCVRLRDAKGGTAPGFTDVYDWDPVAGPGEITDFKGLSVGGAWTLKVIDNVAGFTGTLNYFAIYVVSVGCFNNAECNDNNLCTLDACNNASEGGTCIHSLKRCQPTDNPCIANECQASTGECAEEQATDGAPCDDGAFCTEEDFCQTGVCTGGTPVNCSYLSGNCTVGVCSEDLDQCISRVADDEAPCDDGESCNAGDMCQSGTCMPGSILTCGCPSGRDADCFDDGNKCNGTAWVCNASKMCELSDDPVICTDPMIPCKSNVCDAFDGVCKIRSSLNYLPCEDGLFCSVQDYCLSGECASGAARSCADLDEDCVLGYCDETANDCLPMDKDDGTACELDGRGCSTDKCVSGTCTFDAMIDCSTTGDDCNEGVCSNVGWGDYICIKGPFDDGTVCTDEPNPCTSDLCQAGVCEHTKLTNCSGPCGGSHPFDAGDDVCGVEDSCAGGIAGYGLGGCTPTCPGGTCYKAASGRLDWPINERVAGGGCTNSSMPVSTGFAFVNSADLKLDISHEYLADLTIDLIDPQGNRHRVWNNIGGSNQDFANTFDVSFPIPYPGNDLSGQPMCALRGEVLDGIWTLQICDSGSGNSGTLHDWNLYLKGSDDPALNAGHRCEDAIDKGNQDLNPAITVDGTLECALNSIVDSGCGGIDGPDRMYKFELTTAKRVTIKLLPVPGHSLILFLKDVAGNTCAAGSRKCAMTTDVDSAIIDDQLVPGTYYVGVDTNDGPYGYTPFRFELRVKTLLENGDGCVDAVLGEQDLDCSSKHCQNGFCCTGGDCCPGNAFEVPEDGIDPYLVQATEDWISADTICPAQYKDLPLCNDPDVTDPLAPINFCQGKRWDANCVDHTCVIVEVPDDTACDDTVESDRCGYYHSENCGDHGSVPPAVQVKPDCLTFCTSNTDCDANAHCDPVVATQTDPAPELQAMFCQADLPNGAASNEDSDCISGHSQNGFCCSEGDCCPSQDAFGAATCPSIHTTPASCDTVKDAITGDLVCEGHRYDPVCVDNKCGKELVRDDCRCGNAIADNCASYPTAFCPVAPTNTCPGAGWSLPWESGGVECATTCLTNGSLDDSKCDDDGRCEWDENNPTNGICIPLVVNGGPCAEDSDCFNQQWLPGGIGHCQNGFCCDFGDCCNRPTDCPTPDPRGDYWAPSTCDNWTTCQGTMKNATCLLAQCGSEYVPEDKSCIYDLGSPSDECGYYKSIYCNGNSDQIDPPCPTTCLEAGTGAELDAACDPNAHCDPLAPTYSNAVCTADLANDQACDEDTDCQSEFCQMGYCCDIGGCCAGCRVTKATPSFGNAGYEGPVSSDHGFIQFAPGVPTATRPAVGGRLRGMGLGTFEGISVVTTCWNLVKDQNETDTDCGGRVCKDCVAGKHCIYGTDCVSGVCNAGTCN